jgi:regulator of protease activity HflC (stomatin/prohibitin superfamily)
VPTGPSRPLSAVKPRIIGQTSDRLADPVGPAVETTTPSDHPASNTPATADGSALSAAKPKASDGSSAATVSPQANRPSTSADQAAPHLGGVNAQLSTSSATEAASLPSKSGLSAGPASSGRPQPTAAIVNEAAATTDPLSERPAYNIDGILGLLVVLVGFIGGILLCVFAGVTSRDGSLTAGGTAMLILGLLLLVVDMLAWTSLTVVAPGTTKVLQFFGNYVGTVRTTGLRLVMPLTNKRAVSVKVQNFETREIKVNDSQGNPVIIAAIIVWQVHDTAKAVFSVEKYEKFVTVQAEAALRHIATIHPYDNGEAGEATLRGATDQVAAELAKEVAERVAIAGVTITETRISSLSYAPEIASAMLQRQQAQAVLAARAKIVEGAVTMVESALDRLEREDVVKLNDDRKAAMVSNLLVVLCSDSRAMPTVNTGA